MASLSRKARMQRYSWPLLEDLAFCSVLIPRLADLPAQVRFQEKSALPSAPVNP